MYVLLLALIVGSPCEVKQKDIYILIDSRDTNVKNYDVVSKSRVVLAELSRLNLKPTEEFYIRHEWNVIIEEFEDKRLNKKPEIPSFKFSKAQDYQAFCPGTFSGSWSIIRSLHSILRWEQYILEINDWRFDRSPIVIIRHNYDNRNPAIWSIQPPDHPAIYPRLKDESTAFYFYNYAPRFKMWSKDTENIDTEDGLGTIFWGEYSNFNIWFSGIEDIRHESNYMWTP